MRKIKISRWNADPVKRKFLQEVVYNPIFAEAAELVTDSAPHIAVGADSINSNAIRHAYASGVRDAFEMLVALADRTEKQDDNKELIRPWDHFREEKSNLV
jgi:hypothetical protein